MGYLRYTLNEHNPKEIQGGTLSVTKQAQHESEKLHFKDDNVKLNLNEKCKTKNSKDLKMNLIKKISLSVAAVAILASSSFSGQVLVGGNVPLINNVVGLGVLTLDLASAGTAVNVATFIVNNNSRQFTVSWVLENGGYFVNGARNIPITAAALALSPSNTGTPGAGTAAIGTALVVVGGAVGTPTGAATWGLNTQTTATVNYAVALNATWGAAADALAGLYTEEVTFTIVATL